MKTKENPAWRKAWERRRACKALKRHRRQIAEKHRHNVIGQAARALARRRRGASLKPISKWLRETLRLDRPRREKASEPPRLAVTKELIEKSETSSRQAQGKGLLGGLRSVASRLAGGLRGMFRRQAK